MGSSTCDEFLSPLNEAKVIAISFPSERGIVLGRLTETLADALLTVRILCPFERIARVFPLAVRAFSDSI
jgi:hypothetical protein